MILITKSIKSIKYQDMELFIKLNNYKKQETFRVEEINNICIGIKKIEDFYFVDGISLIISFISLIAWANSFYYSFYFTLFLLLCWTINLLTSRVYFVRIKLTNNEVFKYYFSKSMRYDIFEKVKMTRGHLISSQFILNTK